MHHSTIVHKMRKAQRALGFQSDQRGRRRANVSVKRWVAHVELKCAWVEQCVPSFFLSLCRSQVTLLFEYNIFSLFLFAFLTQFFLFGCLFSFFFNLKVEDFVGFFLMGFLIRYGMHAGCFIFIYNFCSVPPFPSSPVLPTSHYET